MNRRSRKRIENKKNKMAALLEVSNLNEYDRKVKALQKKGALVSQDQEQKTEIQNGHITPPLLIGEVGPSGKRKLSGEAFIALKKKLRENTVKMRQQPNFRLREMGANASLNVDPDSRVPLFFADLQHLIMYSQLLHHSPYSPARWCSLEKCNRLSNTCVILIENISLEHFKTQEHLFPFLSSQFEHKLEFLSPNAYDGDVVKELSMVPLTATQMKKYIKKYGSLNDAVSHSFDVFDTVQNLFPKVKLQDFPTEMKLPQSDKFPRTLLLLSGWQMIEENYPLPIKGLMENKYAGYILTKNEYAAVTPTSKMFGLDCEMCLTTSGDSELTRVSVVDEELHVIYDTLVKPYNKITNYLTKFSGITSKMMKNVTKRLEDVQKDLRELLPKDAILVGQSLCNDLHALKMMHPYVIDTSIIFNITGNRLRKTKLQTLAREFLSERIQEKGGGHCSAEDSSASLKLTQLKLQKSLYFGDAVMGDVQSELRAYPEMGTSNYATSMLKHVTRMDKTALVIGLDDIASRYKFYVDKKCDLNKNQLNSIDDVCNGKVPIERITCKSETSNKQLVRSVCDLMKRFSLTIGHMKLNSDQLDGMKMFKKIDKWISQIDESITTPGFLIVAFTGNSGQNGVCFFRNKI